MVVIILNLRGFIRYTIIIETQKKMKVTFIGTLPPIIGLSPYCLHLSYALSKKVNLEFIDFRKFSHRSTSFSRESKIDEIPYQNILHSIKIKKTLNWYNPLTGIKAGIALKSDILHVQWWISTLFFVFLPIIILARIKKIKVILSVHNILPHEQNKKSLMIDKIVNKSLFPFIDSFIVHNQRNKEKFKKIYKIDEKKISVITHGVLNLSKQETVSQHEARKKLNLPKDKKVILFFGYIREYKGVDILIKAFNQINKDIEKTLLLIVGQPFGVDFKKYKKIILGNNLEEHVKVEQGFVSDTDVGYYFSACDLVVLPYTLLDTHGGIGALALPFKKPIVVSDVGGLPEYVKDENAIVKPNDVQDLYEKIVKILKDEKLQLKLSKDSEELIEELNWDKIADKTVEAYQKLMK